MAEQRDTQSSDIFSTRFPPQSKSAEPPFGYLSVFGQSTQLFDPAKASMVCHNEIQKDLQDENQSVKQFQEALLTQKRQVDMFTKQQRLIEGLTRQLETNSSALEALEAKFQRQGREYQYTEAAVTAAQRELGIKRGRIEELQSDTTRKQQKIEQLEQEVQGYKGICSYVTAYTLVYTFVQKQASPMLMTGSDATCSLTLHRLDPVMLDAQTAQHRSNTTTLLPSPCATCHDPCTSPSAGCTLIIIQPKPVDIPQVRR